MSAVTELGETDPAGRGAGGPSGRGPRPRLGARVGGGDRRRPGPDQRAQPPRQRGRRGAGGRRAGARGGGGRRRAPGPRRDQRRNGGIEPRSSGAIPRPLASAPRSWHCPTPAGADCGPRSGSPPRRAAASAAREAGAWRARSSTPPPLPRGSSGGPLVDLDGRLLGLNSLRLEGGLILACPPGERCAAASISSPRGEAPETPRLGVAVAPPRVARKMRRAVGLPERDGPAGAGRGGRLPGGGCGHRAGRPAGRAGRTRAGLGRRALRHSSTRLVSMARWSSPSCAAPRSAR